MKTILISENHFIVMQRPHLTYDSSLDCLEIRKLGDFWLEKCINVSNTGAAPNQHMSHYAAGLLGKI